MSYSTSTLLSIHTLCFYPQSGFSVTEKLSDCYSQLKNHSAIKGFPLHSIVKQTMFISVADNTEFTQSKQKLLSCAKDFFKIIPPTSVIAQNPEIGSIALEITLIDDLQQNEVLYRHNDKSDWVIVNRCGMKMVFASGSGDNPETESITMQASGAFEKLERILNEEGMEFSSVLRQWNYIEQITSETNLTGSASQHYQIFNDLRSRFYSKSDFTNGFPAATGIGTFCGGITIDIIAISGTGYSAISIKSPVQKDAYTYTEEVLARNHSMSDFCRTSPKFERAKILVTDENKVVFVSGTAAIKGQASIPELSAGIQTEMTIQNILSLISPENLAKHGIHTTKNPVLTYLRIYVKHPEDMQIVKSICDRHFSQLRVLYLIADICRPELLVEIEGIAFPG